MPSFNIENSVLENFNFLMLNKELFVDNEKGNYF